MVIIVHSIGNSLCLGQNTEIARDTLILKTDQSKLKVEKVPFKKIEKFRNSSEFQYEVEPKAKFDLIGYIWYWIIKILEAIFSDKGVAPYFRVLIALVALAFVVYKIIGGNLSGIFSFNKKLKASNGFEYFEEDIHSQDLDKNLSNAIAKQNYRAAIRFYYLKLLKQLDLNELIQWEISKTNLDYQKELLNKNILDEFTILSGIYEYTWYGNFEVNQTHFNLWQSDFQLAIKHINSK
jgi:hypothetical protein